MENHSTRDPYKIDFWFIRPTCHFSCYLFVCFFVSDFISKNLVSSTRYFSRVSGLVFLATTLWLLSYNPLKALKRSCLDLIDGQPPFKSVYTIWMCDTNLLLWLWQEGGNARLDAVTLGDDAWAWVLSVRTVVYCHWQPLRRALSSSPQGILSFWCFCSLLCQVDFNFFTFPSF